MKIAPDLIEIIGGIASGKTTLVKTLSTGGSAVYEDHSINPYWSAFYSNPGQFVFETEVSFLLQHYHFAKLSLNDPGNSLLDHSFDLDLAYCDIGLSGKRADIFKDIYAEIRKELGYPRIVIWCRCSPEVELQRILSRGRKTESGISIGFVRALSQSIENVLKHLPAQCKILEINSEDTDLRVAGTWLENLSGEITASK